jgi:hypothetical protein
MSARLTASTQLDLSLLWTPLDMTVRPYAGQVGARGCARAACRFRCEPVCVWHPRHGEFLANRDGGRK